MSAPAARALYRGLWRQVRRFQADALPITGVVGLDDGPVCIDPLARLRAAFEAPSRDGNDTKSTATARLSEGLQALRVLPHQAAALEHAEEDARALLARWAQLQARWAGLRRRGEQQEQEQERRQQERGTPPPPRPAVNTRVLEAGEEACALAYAATEEQAAERALDVDEADEIRARARRVLELAEPRRRRPSGGGAEAAAGLAERARRAAAAADGDAALSSRYPSARVRAAAAASAALFAYRDGDDQEDGGGRLRFEPVEWAYDGVEAALPQPLLAGEAAHPPPSASSSSSAGGTSSGPPSRAARKGVPLALALAAARCLADAALPGVARCEPVCARDCDAEMAAAGRAERRGSTAGAAGVGGLAALPPAVAARQAGRTVAVAPATNAWLVRLDILCEGQEEAATPWFVDVTRRGELLSAAEARARYPAMLFFEGESDASGEESERATLRLWREVARTLVIAHQRRGEADAVAGWMRAAMALDPAAAEWGRVFPAAAAPGGGGGGGGSR
jgi:hypothetical protein